MDGSTTIKPHVRWLIHRDWDAVLSIEAQAFPDDHWDENELRRMLKNDKVIAMVAEIDYVVVGFVVYQLRRKSVEILNLAVHGDYHRQGIGTAIMNKLEGRLNPRRRNRIFAYIPESQLGAQLWFKRSGYRADKIASNLYANSDDQAYRFVKLVTEDQSV